MWSRPICSPSVPYAEPHEKPDSGNSYHLCHRLLQPVEEMRVLAYVNLEAVSDSGGSCILLPRLLSYLMWAKNRFRLTLALKRNLPLVILSGISHRFRRLLWFFTIHLEHVSRRITLVLNKHRVLTLMQGQENEPAFTQLDGFPKLAPMVVPMDKFTWRVAWSLLPNGAR